MISPRRPTCGLFPALGKFRGDAPVRTWLLAIARRACAAEIGTRSRDRQLAARLAAMPPGTLGTAAEPEPGAQAAASLLIAALDPDRRAAFVLTQILGCSYAESGCHLRLPRRHDPVPRRPRPRGSGTP